MGEFKNENCEVCKHREDFMGDKGTMLRLCMAEPCDGIDEEDAWLDIDHFDSNCCVLFKEKTK